MWCDSNIYPTLHLSIISMAKVGINVYPLLQDSQQRMSMVESLLMSL